MPQKRLFPIQAYDYETGVCADGRQVVMGLLCPNLLAYFFDAEGNLVGREARALSDVAATVAGDKPPYKIFNERFQALIEKQKQQWQAELEFHPATIRVKEFQDGEYPVGIQVLPGHYENLESATWFPDEAERQEFIKSRDRWLAEDKFVWWWARDYFMSKDGEVEST